MAQQNTGNRKSEKVSKKYLTGVGEERGREEGRRLTAPASSRLEVGSLARQAHICSKFGEETRPQWVRQKSDGGRLLACTSGFHIRVHTQAVKKTGLTMERSVYIKRIQRGQGNSENGVHVTSAVGHIGLQKGYVWLWSLAERKMQQTAAISGPLCPLWLNRSFLQRNTERAQALFRNSAPKDLSPSSLSSCFNFKAMSQPRY